ncbi:alpha-tocopherol transfer protein-like [Calliphora vicina]|uniref:alpha-tocopherol transfer protein-like n=1 Tax=Calliphora vicina TaxID=7373 RepID=UPI00325AEB3D
MSKIRPLPPVLQKIAIGELNEDPSRIDADIETLRTWIQQQPHLRARTDDQFLVAFLRGCKYSLEKAKSKIDKFYTLRSKYPELFTLKGMDDEKIKEYLKLGVAVALPTPLNETGPRLMLMRSGSYNPSEYDFVEIMRVYQAACEISLMEDDNLIVSGYTHIMDLTDWSKEHFFQMNFNVMKKLTVFSEEAVPIRPKGFIAINSPSIFEGFYNLVKPMMSEKQVKRSVIYGTNYEKMFETIPLKYLPKEYGGENGSIPELIADFERKFMEYRDYFRESETKYGSDESLRPGKPIDFENLFGMEGSFRKLNVD